MARSILAIVAGFVLIGALSFAGDAVLSMAMPDEVAHGQTITSLPALLISLLYVAVFAIGGCYLTARLAPHHPLRHALILGALGLVFQLAMLPAVRDTVPPWYLVVSLLLVMPYAWIGGMLRERELARTPASTAALA